jgi:hypothetical protein
MNVDALRGLKQPDQRTCGPSSLVAAHMLLDPAYRPASFDADVLALHAQLTAPVSFGHAQLPWPRALGTPPWAAGRAMSSYTGLPYDSRLVRFGDRSDEFTALLQAVSDGHPCPLYIGSSTLPRHVVLAVAAVASGLQVYNPARGTLVEVGSTPFEEGRLTTLGGWTVPWFVVAPEG